MGLESDGTVVAVGGNFYGQCDVSGWTDITQVATGLSHTAGLQSETGSSAARVPAAFARFPLVSIGPQITMKDTFVGRPERGSASRRKRIGRR